MYVCMYVCMCVCKYVPVCMYVCMCVCMYVCMHVCVVCMYVCMVECLNTCLSYMFRADLSCSHRCCVTVAACQAATAGFHEKYLDTFVSSDATLLASAVMDAFPLESVVQEAACNLLTAASALGTSWCVRLMCLSASLID